MSTSYLAHFGFSSAPFSKEIPDDKLWLPSSKVSLIDEVCEALKDRESVLLTGEPGVGKTCVLRAIRQRLPQAGFKLTYCHNATLGRRDFYRQLCFALGLSPSATAAAVFWAVSQHVEELGRERCHPVFLLDEAHLLHQDVLDHLHILLNYQWDSKALLSLVLVGLPDLGARLAMRRNRSLASRLARYVAIGKLTPDDTAEYIRKRLELVGCEKEVFTSDAVAMLHEGADGAHRDLDRLATLALREAARRKKKLVERDVVSRVTAAEEAEAA
ncbi:MAG: AAA family ATPase [Myxococcaceae bacterium]|nr:AAA family ATPase [Myxococcaceae bacterium]